MSVPVILNFVKASFDGTSSEGEVDQDEGDAGLQRSFREGTSGVWMEGRESKPTMGGRTASCPGLSRKGGIPSEMQFLFWS